MTTLDNGRMDEWTNGRAIFDKGATFFGAFDGPTLVGMSVLDHNPLPSGIDRLELAGLWVSRSYRGPGVGKALVRLATEEAHTIYTWNECSEQPKNPASQHWITTLWRT